MGAEVRLAEAIDHIRHALDGDPHPRITFPRILNDAGEHMCSMHSWLFLKQRYADLDLVQDQNYISLPLDFRAVISEPWPNGNSGQRFRRLHATTDDRMVRARSNQFADDIQQSYLYTGGYRADTNSIPRPVFELWPTPPQSETAAFTVAYQAGWSTIGQTEDDVNIPIPVWMEGLYAQYVREVALGYERDNLAKRSERLRAVDQSPECMAAKRRDGSFMRDYGRPAVGALGMSSSGFPRTLETIPAAPGNP